MEGNGDSSRRCALRRAGGRHAGLPLALHGLRYTSHHVQETSHGHHRDSTSRPLCARVIDPNTGKDFVTGKAVQEHPGRRRRRRRRHRARLSGEEPASRRSASADRRAAARRCRASATSPSTSRRRSSSHAVQRGVKLMPGVKNIIAVASGKGGVGKSHDRGRTSRWRWRAEGARVGMLDADIYGPSQPMMLGIAGRPESNDGKTHRAAGEPRRAGDVDRLPDRRRDSRWSGAARWSRRRSSSCCSETNWGDLDYLVVDMPPGTGDIQLTLAQRVPVTGAVIVTTPQDIALLDARKGLKMFEKVGVPILGIVENMSVHVCSNCGHAEHIFGDGGGERMAARVRRASSSARCRSTSASASRPTAASRPSWPTRIRRTPRRTSSWRARTAAALARRAKDRSSRVPEDRRRRTARGYTR